MLFKRVQTTPLSLLCESDSSGAMVDEFPIVDAFCSICMVCFMVKLVGIVEQSTQLVCIPLVQNWGSRCQCLHTFTVEWPQQFTRRKMGRVGHTQKGFQNIAQGCSYLSRLTLIRLVNILLNQSMPFVMLCNAILRYVPSINS